MPGQTIQYSMYAILHTFAGGIIANADANILGVYSSMDHAITHMGFFLSESLESWKDNYYVEISKRGELTKQINAIIRNPKIPTSIFIGDPYNSYTPGSFTLAYIPKIDSAYIHTVGCGLNRYEKWKIQQISIAL